MPSHNVESVQRLWRTGYLGVDINDSDQASVDYGNNARLG